MLPLKVEGIGTGMAEKLVELLNTGEVDRLVNLEAEALLNFVEQSTVNSLNRH
jgi:DNA polymerase/3'-5' exonuclease PolX